MFFLLFIAIIYVLVHIDNWFCVHCLIYNIFKIKAALFHIFYGFSQYLHANSKVVTTDFFQNISNSLTINHPKIWGNLLRENDIISKKLRQSSMYICISN
jgi:hypothetical protein